MIKNIIKIAVITISLLFISTAFASDEINLTKLKNHLLAKEFTKAYEYSKLLEDDLAGDITYDFLSGLAAFGVEDYQTAVFAFERVVINDPSLFDGRYYLGLSYRKIDNLLAAVTEFEILLSDVFLIKPLTPIQVIKVKSQLAATEKLLLSLTSRWSHDIMLNTSSDSNINSGSSQDEITLPDGSSIPLFDSSRKISDGSYSARYHLNYQHLLNQYQSLSVDFSAQDKRYFSETGFNRQMFNFEAKYKHTFADDSSWYLGVKTAPQWFVKKKFRTENAITFGWQELFSPSSQFGLNALFSNVDNAVFEQLAFNRYQASTFFTFRSQFQHVVMLKWYRDVNKMAIKHNNKTSFSASYIVSYPFADKLIGKALFMLEKQKYLAPNPLFNEFSDSTLGMISTELLYTGFKKQLTKLQVNYQNKQVDSGLLAMKIFEFDRVEINLIWTYAF